MWPFKCKQCEIKQLTNTQLKVNLTTFQRMSEKLEAKLQQQEKVSNLKWIDITHELPPINTNILCASADFNWLGFIYMEDGWDYSRQINMQGNGKIWATYTNPESVHWWLNVDEIKK